MIYNHNIVVVMNEAISRAKVANASALSIILKGSSEVAMSLSNPADSASYFDALLLKDHYTTLSSGGILGLLALCSPYFIGESEDGLVTSESAFLYLKAVSLHCDIISGYWHSSMNVTSNARCIIDILKVRPRLNNYIHLLQYLLYCTVLVSIQFYFFNTGFISSNIIMIYFLLFYCCH